MGRARQPNAAWRFICIERDFALPQVTRAIAAKQFDILVVGAGSSLLPGPNGIKNAYPARLEHALGEKLPGVMSRLPPTLSRKRTADEMVKSMPPALAAAKPALVVWQTGTVDAMQSVDPDQFRVALDQGINIARSAGADVVLINAQYSPRTESMIALGTMLKTCVGLHCSKKCRYSIDLAS